MMSNPIHLKAAQALMRDAATGRWLIFDRARKTLCARRLGDVLPMLREVEAAVDRQNMYAAGFVSYEAAPAFDPALATRSPESFPLLWFGLYEPPREMAACPLPADDAPVSNWESGLSADDYRAVFEAIHACLERGESYQVNLTHRLHAGGVGDPWVLFLRLVEAQHPDYGAWVDTGDWAVCSSSPELFFRLDGNLVESQPMKGTARRGRWYAEDRRLADELAASEKNRAENVMIVDMVRNDLGRIAEPGSVTVPLLFEVKPYPTVWQMVSTVRAQTKASLADLFQALFPAASITGAPKCSAMRIIRDLETTPRHLYTGTIGFVAPGRRAQFNVAIRTALVNRRDATAEYGVGGGIVWDSDCRDEAEECRIKARVLHTRRPVFDLLETLLWTPESGFVFMDDHLARLAHSAEYFGFMADIRAVERELRRLAAAWSPDASRRVRLLASRSGACRIESFPLTAESIQFSTVALAPLSASLDDPFLYHKTTHRACYETALKTQPGAGDVLLVNERGEITESTIANVAVERNGVLCTPPLSCGLLPGIMRARMLRTHRLAECVIRREELEQSPAIYLFNSVRGVGRLEKVEEKHGVGPRRGVQDPLFKAVAPSEPARE